MIVVLITYDIASDARRQQLFELLSGQGARVQMSVFECELPGTHQRDELIRHIRRIVEDDYDQVRIYHLGAKPETIVIGNRELEERTAFWII